MSMEKVTYIYCYMMTVNKDCDFAHCKSDSYIAIFLN